jgi:hypothetical protein
MADVAVVLLILLLNGEIADKLLLLLIYFCKIADTADTLLMLLWNADTLLKLLLI